jgi:N-acetylneuraminic acid mutarotase
MEARVYFQDAEEAARTMGDLFGELDIVFVGQTPSGERYFLIDTDRDQLKAIQDKGLRIEITFKDLRDKFRLMTGCDPEAFAGRDFGYYFTYWEMRDTIYRLWQNYPQLVTIDSSKRSFQNKRFYILKISDNPGATENEPQVFINGATHAREPMGTHACVAFASLLCKNYGVDSTITWMVNNREIYICPVMNPDGYVYNSDSGGASSNWRKNRNNQSPRTGPGVDLNRNYAYKWGLNGTGSSSDPRSETYRGPSRFSEPETQVIRDFEAAHKFRTEQDYHTYGRYNLLPWGFSTAWPCHGEDSAAYKELADTMYGNNGYATGPTRYVLYETNGGSVDWEFADTLWNGVRKFITYAVSTEMGITDFWNGWNNPTYVDNELAMNIPNLNYMTRVAGAYFKPAGMVINDSGVGDMTQLPNSPAPNSPTPGQDGNANGKIDPGETGNLWFLLRNCAIHPLDTAKTVTAVLRTSDPKLQVVTASAGFPDILRRSTANNSASQIEVRCDPSMVPGTVVNLRLEVTFYDDGVQIMQPVNFSLTIGSAPVNLHDVGCTKIMAPAGTVDSPAVVTPACSLYNYGSYTEGYTVRMKIASFYDNTMTVVSHASGSRIYVTFPTWTANQIGAHAVSCSTELSGDANPDNDRKTGTITVQRPPVHDVGCTKVALPVGTIDSGATTTPACSVYNFGTVAETYQVRMKIGGFYNNTASVTGHSPLATVYVTFPPYAAWPRGAQTASCSTELAADMQAGNDRNTGSFDVRVHDVGAAVLLAPSGTVDSPAVVTPACSLANYGTVSENYSVRMKIGTFYNSTMAVSSHAAGGKVYQTFPTWNAILVGGPYAVSCSTELGTDAAKGNDRQTGSVIVRRPATHDVSCTKIVAPGAAVDSGTVVTPACSVYNYGNQTEGYSVRMKIGTAYNQTVAIAGHLSLTSRYLTFPTTWTALSVGTLAVSCSTELGGDQFVNNDRAAGSVEVRQLPFHDVGCAALMVPAGIVDSGTVVAPACSVYNYGNRTENYSVRMKIGSAYNLTASVTGHAPLATVAVTFPTWNAILVGGPYAVSCSTELAGDQQPGNNKRSGSVSVRRPPAHDVSCSRLLAPSGIADSGTTIAPACSVYNNGNSTETYIVRMRIGSTYGAGITVANHAPGTRRQVVFPGWNALRRGSYAVRCSTELPSDGYFANDRQTGNVEVRVLEVEVAAIFAPVGEMDSTTPVTPSARVRSFSSLPVTFPTFFQIRDPGDNVVYADSAIVTNLAGGDSEDVSFGAWPLPHAPGSYATRCSTALAGDLYHPNDVFNGAFTISGGIPPIGGWERMAEFPTGPRGKRAKDGCCLAYAEGYIYALKGNNRCEFYQYDIAANAWTAKESIPPIGASGKKKMVKKGASLAQADGKLYATKGNNTVEFWEYSPSDKSYPWLQKADVPTGAKNVKEGTGAVAFTLGETTYVYLLKGSGTQEFYRYNTLSNAWQPMATAPAGLSGKPFKNGSCLAFDGTTIWALKGSYNEFFAYDIAFNTWTTKTSLPLIGSSGRKKKVKDGAGIACLSGNWGLSHGFRPTKSGTVPEFQRSAGCLYVLKGGNTQEFWTYDLAADAWTQAEDIPLGDGKRVKGGGALAYSPDGDALYATKGNNTLEFWRYTPGPANGLQLAANSPNALSNSSLVSELAHPRHSALTIAPNPFSGRTAITYFLPEAGSISLALYDVAGKLVTTLRCGQSSAGSCRIDLDATALARGVYLLKLETERYSTTQKLIIE